MPSASALVGPESSGGKKFPRLLSSANMKGKSVTVLCIGVREAPEGWNSKLVLDFIPVTGVNGEEIGGCALNKTNIRILIELGGDDYDHWAGHSITFEKQKCDFMGRQVDGLRVIRFTGVVSGWKAKAKEYLADDDIPF